MTEHSKSTWELWHPLHTVKMCRRSGQDNYLEGRKVKNERVRRGSQVGFQCESIVKSIQDRNEGRENKQVVVEMSLG